MYIMILNSKVIPFLLSPFALFKVFFSPKCDFVVPEGAGAFGTANDGVEDTAAPAFLDKATFGKATGGDEVGFLEDGIFDPTKEGDEAEVPIFFICAKPRGDGFFECALKGGI